MSGVNRQSEEFFEARYRSSTDPWHFASSRYELNRYRATINALARSSYRRAFEPGCSVGVLTAALAQVAKQVIACDISETAVNAAKQRCLGLHHVEIYRCDLSASPPAGQFDLMVFSELGYYFRADHLGRLARHMGERLEPGGEFVAVHWLGMSPDHVLHGDEVHQVLGETLPFEHIGGSRHGGFRIDSWRRLP